MGGERGGSPGEEGGAPGEEGGSPGDKGGSRRERASREAPMLPDRSEDDTDRGWGDSDDDSEVERRLVENRPPHWE